jgi:hypothetical protein
MIGYGTQCSRFILREMRKCRSSIIPREIAYRYLYSRADVLTVMDEHLPPDNIRHRAFLVRHQNTFGKPQSNLAFCQDAFARAGTKPTIFRELRDNIERLDEAQIQDFVSGLDTSLLSTRVFALKVARLTNRTKKYSTPLSQATAAIESYSDAQNAGTSSPKCIVIAAQSLIQHAFSLPSEVTTEAQTLLLRAAAVLELSIAKNEDYFPIPILLVQLYRYLGLFSLAFSTFISLSIKNLQWETVGHLVLTRVGSLHPHQPHDEATDRDGKSKPMFDPAYGLDTTIEVSDKTLNGLNESVKRGLREGSYSNIIEAVETRKRIKRSVWRRICTVEEQKVARMTSDMTLNAWASDNDEQELCDQRDPSFVPNYCKADEQLWRDLECGPTPKQGWLKVMVLQERLVNCLRESVQDGAVREANWTALQECHAHLRGISQEDELTKAEQECYVMVQKVYEVVYTVLHTKKQVPDALLNALTDGVGALVNVSAEAQLDDVGVPWRQAHLWYTTLDIAHLTHLLSAWSALAEGTPESAGTAGKGKKAKSPASASKSMLSKEQRTNLATKAKQAHEDILSQARKTKARFNEGGLLGGLLERLTPDGSQDGADGEAKQFGEKFGALVEAAGGEVALETVVGKWLASWEDACEGVLGVRLPQGMEGGK